MKSDGVRLQTDDGSNGFVPSSLRKGLLLNMNCDLIELIFLNLSSR